LTHKVFKLTHARAAENLVSQMKHTILLPLIAATFMSLPLAASFGQDTSYPEQ
jgi:hypothetical protein